SEKESLRQQWNQLLCVFIYLADENLAMRLGLNPLLPAQSREVVTSRYATTFANILPDTALWEGYDDLTAETRKASLPLQSLKQGGLTLANVNLLPELEHLERALGRWRRQHGNFAPASYALQHYNSNLTDPNVTALARLADRATGASYHMLSVVVDLAPSHLLRYLPVRCRLCIVAANLHLQKSTLTANPDVTDSDRNIQLLCASIASIRGASPDDTRMAIRYARFLLNASMRSSSSAEGGAHAGHSGNADGQEHPHDVSGGQGHAAVATEEAEWWLQYPMMASAPGMETIASLNLHLNLLAGLGTQIGRDPFRW
ncbi:hypothetical protein C8A03DRAFT_18126, partial [Achaetomium macrosporum]